MATIHRTVLRVFVASPGDLVTEREVLAEVVSELNETLGAHLGLELELKGSSQVVPNVGRPQRKILDEIPAETWDIFLGMVWSRFGTPSGETNPSTGRAYESGTEEEFHVAREAFLQTGKPRVLVYRCTRDIPVKRLDPAQFKRVQYFFENFEQQGAHPGLFQEFESAEQFKRRARKDLSEILLSHVKWWTEHNPLLLQLMEKLGRVYRRQQPPPFRYHRALFEVTAALWDTPSQPCTVHLTLEFSPHKHPIHSVELSLVMSPSEGLMTSPEISVRDHNGKSVDIEQVPITDPTQPRRRSLLVHFLPPLRSGRFTLYLVEKGNLREEDLKDLVYSPERLQGAFGEIQLIVHFPPGLRLRMRKHPKSLSGRQMKPEDFTVVHAPANYQSVGWIGRQLRLSQGQRFGVLVSRSSAKRKNLKRK
jgi:hypothetical protein